MWQPSQRYPDASIEILDPSFAPYRIFSAAVERLASGTRWGEGPVWFGDGRYLVWSDIPEQSHPEMGGGDGGRRRLPQALRIRQWQHARQAGAAHHLRAWWAARDAHRV